MDSGGTRGVGTAASKSNSRPAVPHGREPHLRGENCAEENQKQTRPYKNMGCQRCRSMAQPCKRMRIFAPHAPPTSRGCSPLRIDETTSSRSSWSPNVDLPCTRAASWRHFEKLERKLHGKNMNMKSIETLHGRPSRTIGRHVDHDRPRNGPRTSCSCAAALLPRDSFLQILSASSSMSAFAAAAAQTSMASESAFYCCDVNQQRRRHTDDGSSITKVEACQFSRSVPINFVMVSSAAMLHAVRG